MLPSLQIGPVALPTKFQRSLEALVRQYLAKDNNMAVGFALMLLVSLILSGHGVSAATTLKMKQNLEVGDRFSMFAYGNHINGLPIFFADGTAVIADFETARKTDNLVPVSCKLRHTHYHDNCSDH
jgi:hypothetical protein